MWLYSRVNDKTSLKIKQKVKKFIKSTLIADVCVCLFCEFNCRNINDVLRT